MPAFQVTVETKHGERVETVKADDGDRALTLVIDRIPELELEALRRYDAGAADCADRVRIGRWKRAQVTRTSVTRMGA